MYKDCRAAATLLFFQSLPNTLALVEGMLCLLLSKVLLVPGVKQLLVVVDMI